MVRRIIIATYIVLATGCATNPYAQFYQSAAQAMLQSLAQRRVEPAPASPELLRGNDPKDDILSLESDGWIVIGASSFNGPRLSARQAIEQAKAVGADRVVVYGRLSSTERTIMPLTLPTTQTSVTNGTATAFGPNGMATAYGSATTTTYGTSTTYLPLTIRRYDALAIYLVKVKFVLGANFRNLNALESQHVGSVNGVVLVAVVRGSPAAAAGFLPGDVIAKADGQPVIDFPQLSSFLEQRQGRTVAFIVIRGDRTFGLTATLGSY
jgi:hypothetical protein